MRFLLWTISCLCFTFGVFAQNSEGELHGNMQIDAQYYTVDTAIGAVVPDEKMAGNSFVNLNYTKGVFSTGLRYEAYLPALQGFSPQYNGTGIPYRYARVNLENLTVVLGNFYDQFGSGIIFRSYEERGLGYDNAMDGAMVRYSPLKGVDLKGIIGKQRVYFEQSNGTVRGIDAEVNINQLFDSLPFKQNIRLGASFVSKFQQDNSSTYNLPENVGAFGLRGSMSGKKYRLFTEYTYKVNDPSSNNDFIYKPGNAFIGQFSYFVKGFGFSVDVKRIDNMSFRSEREATLSDLLINFSPSFTRQHTYNLLATLYPYATQLNGEIGGQFEMQYKFKKKSALGGKYGTTVLVNYSVNHGLDTTQLNGLSTSRIGYTAKAIGLGEQYFQDINIEVTKKINKKWKGIFTYANLAYNKDVLEGKSGFGLVRSQVGVADLTYKIKPKNVIRLEAQALFTQQDQGDWATLLVEYNYAYHWFFALMDQYNYGNKNSSKQVHYYLASLGYNAQKHRVSLSYGRQRAGIFCVGGVCRNVPAANGITLNLSTNF